MLFNKMRMRKLAKRKYKVKMAKFKVKMAKLEVERLDNIKKVNPEHWNFPQPCDMAQFLYWKERWIFKLRRMAFMRHIPGINRWAIKRPVIYTFIFYPNNRLGMQAIETDIANGTLPLKTRTMMINPKKTWHFGTDSAQFHNYNCAEPLDVLPKTMEEKTCNPVLYKNLIEEKVSSTLLTQLEGAVSNKIILYVLIAIGLIALFILCKQMGWIPASVGK
jgi:hypothetical protein